MSMTAADRGRQGPARTTTRRALAGSVALLGALLVAPPALAEAPVKILPPEPPPRLESKTGPTLGLSLTGSVLFHDTIGGDLGNLAIGGTVSGGYRFSPNWYAGARLTLGGLLNTLIDAGMLFGVGGELRYRFRPAESVVPWVGAAAGFELRKLIGERFGRMASATGYGIQLPEVMAGVDFRTSASLRIGLYVGLATGIYVADTTRGYTIGWIDSGIRAEYDL